MAQRSNRRPDYVTRNEFLHVTDRLFDSVEEVKDQAAKRGEAIVRIEGNVNLINANINEKTAVMNRMEAGIEKLTNNLENSKTVNLKRFLWLSFAVLGGGGGIGVAGFKIGEWIQHLTFLGF
jgi:hypothetical protein